PKGKFEAKGKKYVMVGYDSAAKAYRLFDLATKAIIVSRDLSFIEPSISKECASVELEILERNEADLNDNNIEVANNSLSNYESAQEENEEESDIQRIGPGRLKLVRSGMPGRTKKEYHLLNLLCDVDIPNTVDEAMSSEYADEWRKVMREEYQALLDNETWNLVDLPENENVIKCKWVFAVKKNKAGEINRFKARLVAKGCSQIYGVNYTDTFSPVVRYSTIRIIFALAAEYELYLHHVDYDIYMAQPEAFVSGDHPNKVLKLKKALYGLKQAGRQWNVKLHEKQKLVLDSV
ncbi:unnamed protein product, partial [Ceratitis capitata]